MTATPMLAIAADRIRSRLLDELNAAEQENILAAAMLRRVPAGTVVSYQEEPADYFFMVAKGCAQHFYITPHGKKIGLFWLAQGSVFGGMAILPVPSHYLVGTEAVKDSQILAWPRAKIRSLAAQYPRLLENALVIASEYFTWYVATHLSLVCHTARERVAHVLMTLAESIGQKNPAGIQLEITNEQLASTANVTIFTASRLLSEWQRSGAIAKGRGKIVLRSPGRLFLSSPPTP